MRWSGEAIILSARRHGETAVIAEVFARKHGRHAGLVHGGRSRAMRPVLQAGNIVRADWRARLCEHLGVFTLEPVSLRAARLIDDPLKLAGLVSITALTHIIPEREDHVGLYEALRCVLDALIDDISWLALMVRWELGLLQALGFGLDLTRCVVTGKTVDLAYVSPKSGHAVSAGAGWAWHKHLLALPAFLLGGPMKSPPEIEDIRNGFMLTGYFLNRHIMRPRGLALPQARARLIAGLR